MRRDEIFPSKYLRASDLPQPRVVTVASAAMEPLKNDGKDVDKLVLSFRDRIKSLIVNLTNFESIAALYGDETDTWAGQRIELYADRCRFGSKMVDCVRVRRPPQTSMLPSGNRAARPPQPQPSQPEERPTPPVEAYNDAIPW
jgi:hypothetical protein